MTVGMKMNENKIPRNTRDFLPSFHSMKEPENLYTSSGHQSIMCCASRSNRSRLAFHYLVVRNGPRQRERNGIMLQRFSSKRYGSCSFIPEHISGVKKNFFLSLISRGVIRTSSLKEIKSVHPSFSFIHFKSS